MVCLVCPHTGCQEEPLDKRTDGFDLADLPALACFLGKLTFTPVAERRVEGDGRAGSVEFGML